MSNALAPIKETLLMGPGPSSVHPSVYKALAMPTVGHLDPRFIAIMDEIKVLLREAFGTRNELTLPMSGTGSSGMETAFVNIVEPGDRVLVLVNGVFGKRMIDVAERLGAEVDSMEFEWGTPVVPEKVEAHVDGKSYKIAAVVHAETSTGVRNPVEEIGQIVQSTGALFLIDTVTSLGGIEVSLDSWGVDIAYSGTQKCLSVPPGLAPVSFSEKAVEVLKNRKKKVPNWYLDLSMIIDYWQGAKRSYHHTAPINMLYALYQGLLNLHEEGYQAAFKRHLDNHLYLVEKLGELGLDLLVDPAYRLPMLNAVKCPEGVDEAPIRSKLLSDHGIEIGAGLGPLAGKIWRIGLMGHTARRESVDALHDALKALL